MDDAEIIELFFARSERAIEELQNRYGAALYALAFNILGSREDAEECVSDACLGAWNAIPPARPEKLGSWALRLARNRALAMRRSRHAAKRYSPGDAALHELEGALPAPGEVGDALAARELTEMIERFLDGLSAENRAIFLRRYWYADSLGEIARRTGLSEKAVGARLARLRGRLREYLAQGEVYV